MRIELSFLSGATIHPSREVEREAMWTETHVGQSVSVLHFA